MTRISNSFSAGEIAAQQHLVRKLLMDPRYRDHMKGAGMIGVMRKFQAMEERVRESDLQSQDPNKASLPSAAE